MSRCWKATELLGSMIEYGEVCNNAMHSSTRFTSFYLCCGRHLGNPTKLLAQVEPQNEAANEFIGWRHEDLDQAIQNLRNA